MNAVDEFRSIFRYYVYYTHNSGTGKILWNPSVFHKFLCDEVQRFLEKKTNNPYDILIITTPPQHGKSETVTCSLPAWYLCNNPDNKVIIVSYGDTNAKKFGKKNLDKVKRFGDMFGISLDPAKANAKEFRIADHEGVCYSAGYGGGITSNSADLMVIDDPVKNVVQADSEKDRDTKWDDFLMSLDSRMSAGGKIILIMTRWHENDLAGMLLETFPEQCQLINLPLEAEENDVMGRKPGEPLCPEMVKGKQWVALKKKTLMRTESGTRTWNALWQGRPSALEGNLLMRDWWEFYEYAEYEAGKLRFDRMIMTIDAAFKDQKKNDYVAIGVWGKREGRIYLVDLVNEHLSFPQTVRKVRILAARYPKIKGIFIEEAANGMAIIQTLQREGVMGVVGVPAVGSKYSKAEDASFYIEAGNVYLPKDKKFVWEFIDQCASFPNGKHDDMVDCMTMAVKRLTSTRSMKRAIAESMQESVWDRMTKPKSKSRGDYGSTITPV